jgi:N utilization substance protein A
VVQELRGEKIDIVTWDADPAKFIVNALSPAEIVRVIVDETNRSMEVVVPDDQLSLAIGRRGQNVRLASKLSGWHLDVVGETAYSQNLRDAYASLLNLDEVGEATATSLYQSGFRSAEDVAGTTAEELMTVRGIGEEKASKLIGSAEEYVKKKQEEAREEEEAKAAEPTAEEASAEDVEGTEGGEAAKEAPAAPSSEEHAEEKGTLPPSDDGSDEAHGTEDPQAGEEGPEAAGSSEGAGTGEDDEN